MTNMTPPSGFYLKPAGTQFLDGLPQKPVRVWFVYPHVDRTKVFVPQHHHNARLEDYGHDWKWQTGRSLLRYCPAVDPLAETWLFCEFE